MFEGDDGRYYSSEAEWEYEYNEGCKAEMRAILEQEARDWGDDGYEEDDFIGPIQPRSAYAYPDDEIPW